MNETRMPVTPIKKVCLVMVTYNRYEILLHTIAEISKQTRKPDYFIIVDNFSSDNTFAKLQTLANEFEIIQMTSNVGYGAAATGGINYAKYKYTDISYFWIMDDDSRPTPNALYWLEKSFQSVSDGANVGMIGLLGFNLKFGGYTRILNQKMEANKLLSDYIGLIKVDFVLMDGCLIKEEVIKKCGAYREDYFMIGEDYEYCKRVLRAGFNIGFLRHSDAELIRLVLGGGGGFSRSNIWRGYYQARNHFLILNNYFSFVDTLAYFFRQAKFITAALMANDRFERIRFRLLGIYHGLRGISGKTIEPFN